MYKYLIGIHAVPNGSWKDNIISLNKKYVEIPLESSGVWEGSLTESHEIIAPDAYDIEGSFYHFPNKLPVHESSLI